MHTMDLIREHEGTEEWMCPECGRHMLVNWKPKFKRTILAAGNPTFGHTAFKNNVQPQDLVEDRFISILPEREVMEPADETRLTPWISWMDKINYSNLWNNNAQ